MGIRCHDHFFRSTSEVACEEQAERTAVRYIILAGHLARIPRMQGTFAGEPGRGEALLCGKRAHQRGQQYPVQRERDMPHMHLVRQEFLPARGQRRVPYRGGQIWFLS